MGLGLQSCVVWTSLACRCAGARLQTGQHIHIPDESDRSFRFEGIPQGVSGIFRRGTLSLRAICADWRSADLILIAITVLVGLRFALSAALPLSFDEAYYWLWSKHLAPGYFEHPAAIAVAIRGGTLLFGDTEFGVRFASLVASVVASWAVWRSAAIVLARQNAGAIACLFFNLMLMIAAEGMGATPDALLIAAAALLLWSVAELEQSQDSRWWLAVGAAAGLALAAKYTGFFLVGAIVAWLALTAFQSRTRVTGWFGSVWPYAGAAIALALFAPTLYWNATHDFISFHFQFGRITAGHLGVTYFLQFLGSQIALASPGILVLAVIGSRAPFGAPGRSLLFALAVVWPPLLYFALHSLHDRVQGNWPCFVYPPLAVLAASGYFSAMATDASPATRWACRLTVPAACLILLVSYVQAIFGVIPVGKTDPIARMMGVGLRPVMAEIAARARNANARAIITTNYAATSWLRFYERSPLPVIQLTDDRRLLSSPRASANGLSGTLLYVTQHAARELPAVAARFSQVGFSERITRSRAGRPIDVFDLYAVSGFHGPATGRIP